MKENKTGYKEILRQKEYMKIVTAAVVNRFGDSIDSIALTWLVYQITQSAAWSAVIFGVNRIPTIFLQPFAGAAVEGKNKKRIMAVTDIIRGICVGIIASAYLIGFLDQWILLALTIIISCAEAFRGPASSAILPKVLDKQYYAFGLSLNSSACNAAELIGLGAAGVIISAFSVSAAIYIDMATFFGSALIILTLKAAEGGLTKSKINARKYIGNLKGGFLYLKGKAALRYFVILAVFLNAVLVPFNSLQAPLVSEVLHTDEIMLSVLGIAITVGMIAGAAVYPYISNRLSKHVIVIIGTYSIAALYFTFVIVGKYVASAVIIYIVISLVSFLVGMAVALLTSFSSVEFMKAIESDYMARVSAIYNASCVAAIPVVSFLISVLAGFTPTIVIFFIFGILNVVICLKLCSRKRFAAMEGEKAEKGEENGREVEDSTAF